MKTNRRPRRAQTALLAGIAGVLALALTGTAIGRSAANSIKLSHGPTSVKFGSRTTYTVSGRGHSIRGTYHRYPPNLVTVDVLTSRAAHCPSRLGGGPSTKLKQVLAFHSKRTSQVLSHFSRKVSVTADGSAYGLCAYLLSFPVGYTYAHASAYWTVTGTPPRPGSGP